jgi:hypothetical protein
VQGSSITYWPHHLPSGYHVKNAITPEAFKTPADLQPAVLPCRVSKTQKFGRAGAGSGDETLGEVSAEGVSPENPGIVNVSDIVVHIIFNERRSTANVR